MRDERLVGIGVRPTKQRLLVLETLAAEPHDATAQEIVGDDEANARLAKSYREPWKRPTTDDL